MNNSSQQKTYSITSNHNLLNRDIVTIDLTSNCSYESSCVTMNDITTSSCGNTYTINSNSEDYINAQYEIDFGDEWVTRFPDFYQVSVMCKHYPALEKALENFKTVYELVKDDYANKNKDNQI